MVRKVIRKKHPALQKAKTRSRKKMQGDLTNLEMLRLLNSFVVLKRCPDAERLVLMNRPTYRGRRNSVAVGYQVNQDEPVIDIDREQMPPPELVSQPRPQPIRNRSFSVFDDPHNRAPLDHNLDEFRAMLDDKIAPIDEQDEGQMDDVQENAAEEDESLIGETQMDESHIEEGQSEEIQIQDIEAVQTPTPDGEIITNDCVSDSDASNPELNAIAQQQHLEDESFALLLAAELLPLANKISEVNETSTTQVDAEPSIELDENGNDVSNLEDSGITDSVIESDPLETSTSDTGISSDDEVFTSDVTDSPEIEAAEANPAIDLTMEDSENSVSFVDETDPLDLSRSEVSNNLPGESVSVDLTALPKEAVPIETDRTEATQNDDNTANTRQGQAESIEDQHPVEEISTYDSTDSEEMSSEASNDSSHVEVPSTNSSPKSENDTITATTNGIDQTTEEITSIDDGTSDKDDKDPLDLSHTTVSHFIKQETTIESTTPMDIDRIDTTQQDEGSTCDGHEDMLQDEAMDPLGEAVPIDDSQSDQGIAFNLSQKLIVASVLVSVNTCCVGPVENAMPQIKEEIEVIVNENGDAEHKENVA